MPQQKDHTSLGGGQGWVGEGGVYKGGGRGAGAGEGAASTRFSLCCCLCLVASRCRHTVVLAGFNHKIILPIVLYYRIILFVTNKSQTYTIITPRTINLSIRVIPNRSPVSQST